ARICRTGDALLYRVPDPAVPVAARVVLFQVQLRQALRQGIHARQLRGGADRFVLLAADAAHARARVPGHGDHADSRLPARAPDRALAAAPEDAADGDCAVAAADQPGGANVRV